MNLNSYDNTLMNVEVFSDNISYNNSNNNSTNSFDNVFNMNIDDSSKWMIIFPGFGIALDKKGPLRRLVYKIKDLDFNVIVFNLRGHYKSKGLFTYDSMKKDIVYFVNKFYEHHKNLYVFGHSISATAILDSADKLPVKLKLILFAPVIRAARFPNWFNNFILKMSKNKLFLYTVLRFMLFIANIKTTNIKYIGVKNSFSHYGWCWLGKHRIKELVNESIKIRFEFHKIEQKGVIIYGSKDSLLKPIIEDYERNILRTSLDIKKINNMKHHFKVWFKRNEKKIFSNILNSIVVFDNDHQ